MGFDRVRAAVLVIVRKDGLAIFDSHIDKKCLVTVLRCFPGIIARVGLGTENGIGVTLSAIADNRVGVLCEAKT